MKDSIITDNLSSWERGLRLFESTTGLTTSLFLASGKRVVGPVATSPLGLYLKELGIFETGGVGQRAEEDELIPVVALKEKRIKLFADALTILCVPILFENKVIGVIYAGWVFDHFADPIECDRLSRLFGTDGVNLWQIARMQAPVSQEKLRIYEEMLTLIVSTMSEQMISVKELKEASRIKDELLALVSHELLTPLTSLLLRVQMLKTHRISDEKWPAFISAMESSTLMQTKMVEDLLDAASIVAGKLSLKKDEIDLKKLIEDCLELISVQASKAGVRIEFIDVGGHYLYEGDSLRIKQVVLNLVMNAIRFNPKGTAIKVSLIRNVTGYAITVKDKGVGIERDFLPKIFERFSQEKHIVNSRSGLGLGLFIVRKIVELHEGTINVMSEGKNKGTEIEIILPRLPVSADQVSHREE